MEPRTENGKKHHERIYGSKTVEAQEAELQHRLAWPLKAAGVAAASGLGLLLANLVGVGELAIAGAAGYLAWRRFAQSNK
jgi:hypothetical protein